MEDEMVTKLFFTQILAMGVLVVILMTLVGFNVPYKAKIAKVMDRVSTAVISLAVLLGVEAVVGALYLIWAM